VMSLTRAAEVGILLGRWDWSEHTLRELFTVLRNTGGRAFLADALEMGALLQERRGHPGSSTRLFGAAERVRQETNETADDRPVTPLLSACRQRVASTAASAGTDLAAGRAREAVPRRDFATFALRELDAPPAAEAASGRSLARSGMATAGRLRRGGRRWRVGYGEVDFELPDAKGLGYLARLLAEPDREIHVLDLVGTGGSADRGDAGPVLDERAKAAYRRRVRELQEEMEEAQAWNDPERSARAELELDAVMKELAAGVGLGGRDRMTANAAERARVSVRKAIATAVAQIRGHDPELGLLLATTVKTGLYCRYTPDPRLPVVWEL
ncbi:MAG: hypothetical protein LC792_22655, partial [Actinobacteria bacterium]|nr:hypothetical protein [Actinomycetota bacterium]